MWDAITDLDRPYKRGIRGIDRNLTEDGPIEPIVSDIGFLRRDP